MYITKGNQVDNYYALATAAKKSLAIRTMPTPANADIYTPDQLQARALLIRLFDLIGKATQISANIVSTLLLGLPMNYTPESFTNVYISKLVSKIEASLPCLNSERVADEAVETDAQQDLSSVGI